MGNASVAMARTEVGGARAGVAAVCARWSGVHVFGRARHARRGRHARRETPYLLACCRLRNTSGGYFWGHVAAVTVFSVCSKLPNLEHTQEGNNDVYRGMVGW